MRNEGGNDKYLYEYFAKGYNMFEGFPESKGVDPGFLSNPIFETSYTQGRRTGDGRFQIPDTLNILGDLSCSYLSSSNSFEGMSQYHTELNVAVNASGSYDGFVAEGSFSANVEYGHMSNKMMSGEKQVVIKRAECKLFHTEL